MTSYWHHNKVGKLFHIAYDTIQSIIYQILYRKRLYLLWFLISRAYNFSEIASIPYIYIYVCMYIYIIYVYIRISYYEYEVFSKVYISATVNDRNLPFVLPALILLKSMCTNFQGRILILKWFFKHVNLAIFANSYILSITAAGKF